MNRVYMIGGLRTPIGKTGGTLKDFLPEQLAAAVLNGVVHTYNLLPQDIDQVLLGNAVGPGGNIARVSVLAAGWPYTVPAITIDAQCGSGLSAVNSAVSQIQAGQADLILAGGVESTSMAPRRQFNPADPRFQGEQVYYERAPFSTPEIGDPETGEAAEALAASLSISREEMDALALESHRKASLARDQGLLADVLLPLKGLEKTIDRDECIRDRISLMLLERMKPAFIPGGRITAGNTCLTHDGAAIILLASAKAMARHQLTPQAVITGTASAGCDPNRFPLGPVRAIDKLLRQHGLQARDVAAVEINEAFAVKILACCRQLGISLHKTNILGGALAYGHPYGASGAIILLHLLKALEKTGGQRGIAAIGAVGGMGIATLLERC